MQTETKKDKMLLRCILLSVNCVAVCEQRLKVYESEVLKKKMLSPLEIRPLPAAETLKNGLHLTSDRHAQQILGGHYRTKTDYTMVLLHTANFSRTTFGHILVTFSIV